VDIVPTILEATGIPAPVMVNGVAQKPMEGVSLAYTFDKANANSPSRHRTQYFEMMADRAIYQDGWMASTKVIRPPWDVVGAVNPNPADNVTWELYDLTKDWTQFNDVAAANPAKLKQMEDLFWVEAAKYNVLPLDASVATRVVVPKPSLAAGRTTFTYSGVLTGIPPGDAPNLLNTSYTITAEVEVPPGVAEGMLNTNGGRFGGYGFYLLRGKPIFTWNLLDLKRVRWEGPDALAPGKHTLEFDFKYDGLGFATLAFNNLSGIGRSGTGVLKVDGKVVSTQTMEHTIPIILQFDETFDVGADTGTPVDDKDYQVPFKFTGKLNKLTLSIERPKLTPEDERKLMEGYRGAQEREVTGGHVRNGGPCAAHRSLLAHGDEVIGRLANLGLNPYLGRMFRGFDFCLPTKSITVPSRPDWLHEVKYDGYRLRLERDGDRVRLITRGG
jgi:arylsulfatase